MMLLKILFEILFQTREPRLTFMNYGLVARRQNVIIHQFQKKLSNFRQSIKTKRRVAFHQIEKIIQ